MRSADAEPRALRRVWWAFLLAPLLCAGAGALAPRSEGIPQELVTWLVVFVSLLSLLQALTLLLLSQLIAGLAGGSYRRYCLLRWSLAESVALYGSGLWILGAPAGVFGAHLGLAVALLLARRPSVADRESFRGILR